MELLAVLCRGEVRVACEIMSRLAAEPALSPELRQLLTHPYWLTLREKLHKMEHRAEAALQRTKA
jgi:hypothetical protein